jgi:hypothetical protein
MAYFCDNLIFAFFSSTLIANNWICIKFTLIMLIWLDLENHNDSNDNDALQSFRKICDTQK